MDDAVVYRFFSFFEEIRQERRSRNMSKETCIHIRQVTMKNESTETHVHQKRPIYNKKDQKTSNETNKQTRRRDQKTQ